MSGDLEFGVCDICGKNSCLKRKYYYYNIKCECHSPNHFEVIKYCKQCASKVKPPKEIKVILNGEQYLKGEN
ncbi:MAG: hypothetical protein ACI4VL_06185 [Bacilli bacterium]